MARWHRRNKALADFQGISLGICEGFFDGLKGEYMNKKIHFVDIQKLVAHERTNHAHLIDVQAQIHACGMVRRPVVVDKDSGVILDGHHRVKALKALGAVKVPVLYVRYKDMGVRVYLRRKELLMDMVKKFVVERAKSHKLFPSKTTRHVVYKGRPTHIVLVSDLMR